MVFFKRWEGLIGLIFGMLFYFYFWIDWKERREFFLTIWGEGCLIYMALFCLGVIIM